MKWLKVKGKASQYYATIASKTWVLGKRDYVWCLNQWQGGAVLCFKRKKDATEFLKDNNERLHVPPYLIGSWDDLGERVKKHNGLIRRVNT